MRKLGATIATLVLTLGIASPVFAAVVLSAPNGPDAKLLVSGSGTGDEARFAIYRVDQDTTDIFGYELAVPEDMHNSPGFCSVKGPYPFEVIVGDVGLWTACNGQNRTACEGYAGATVHYFDCSSGSLDFTYTGPSVMGKWLDLGTTFDALAGFGPYLVLVFTLTTTVSIAMNLLGKTRKSVINSIAQKKEAKRYDDAAGDYSKDKARYGRREAMRRYDKKGL
jgi:hypothetical protein